MGMLHRILKKAIDYVICFYLVLILVIMPFYNRQGYARIGTDKAYFFDTVVTYMGKILIPVTGIYLVLSAFYLRRELWDKFRGGFSITDFFAAGYGLALVLSWLCSDYRQDSLWGVAGWFMGLWPQLALVLCYLFVSKLWTPRKWVVYLALAASWVVFLLGWLNRAGVDPLGMNIGNSSFISTIGNINWYCGYLVSIFFAGVALLWQCREQKLWQRTLLMLYIFVGFGSLVTQGSDSGLLALAAVVLTQFVLSASDSSRMLIFWQEMVLLGIACVITYLVDGISPGIISPNAGMASVFFTGWHSFFVTAVSAMGLILTDQSIKRRNYPEKALCILARALVCAVVSAVVLLTAATTVNTLRPGSLGALSGNSLFTFSDKWGSSRGATWQAGWMCFVEQDFVHKLVGVGPDAMSKYEYQAGSQKLQELLEENFGKSVLANAHNEWLTVLVDVGVLGVVAFVGMMLSGIWRFLKKDRNRITCACGLCLLAYTVNNQFSFQQSMNTATIFAIFGIGGAFLRAEGHIDIDGKLREQIGKWRLKAAQKRGKK